MGSAIVTGVTFSVFMAEALIHYNMGMAKAEGDFKFRLPPSKELVKIAAVTGAFSLLSSALIKGIERVAPELKAHV